MTCKDFCTQWKTSLRGRYIKGDKFCTTCDIFFKDLPETVINCPCCKTRLSTRPKSSKYKEKLREAKLVKA